MLRKIFPFISQNRYTKNKLRIRNDILAGITVSFVLIPQSMAYAQLAGLPVQMGLYSSFIPVIIASIFGFSNKMISSSITIMSLMTFTILSSYAIPGSEEYIILASILAFFVGIFYILLGKLRLGVVVNFLSHPVIIGFTNAAALVTIMSQIPKIFGVSKGVGENYLFELLDLGKNILYYSDFPTMICGIGSLIFLFIGRKIFPKLPVVLFLLILIIPISYFSGYNNIYGAKIIGNIPSGLPPIDIYFIKNGISLLHFKELLELFIFSILIALIGFAQTISVAKYLSYIGQNKLSPNKELVGQGLANISSAFFGGYCIAGSLSRTALNIRAGATTRISGIVAGGMVGITIIFLTPFLYYLPISSLGAIIIIAVFQMIQFKPLIQAWKIEKQDAIVGIITFIVSILSLPNIEIGILTGVFSSLLFFMYRSMKPKIIELGYYKDGSFRDIDLFGLKSSKDIGVYRFDGYLYFANSGHFESSILNYIAEKKKIKCIILDFEWVNNIDSTAEKTIISLTKQLQENNIKIYITGVRTGVFHKLTTSKFIKNFGENHFMKNIHEALDIIEEKYGKEIDTSSLRKYKKDKNKEPTLEKKVMRKIEKL